MWRKLSIFFALFFLLTPSFALTYIYYPTSGTVSDNGVFYIGKVGKNHIVKLILNAQDPSPIESITTDIPSEINYSVGRAFITFKAPSRDGNYAITLVIKRKNGIETVRIAFDVVSRPLEVVLGSSEPSVPEAGDGTLDVAVINHGVGLTKLSISSLFPSEPTTAVLPPHEVVKRSLTLHGGLSGEYSSEVVVKDELSGETYKVPITVTVYPTLSGRVKTVYLLADPFLPILQPIRLLLGVIFWRT